MERLKCFWLPNFEDKSKHPLLQCFEKALKHYKLHDKVDWNYFYGIQYLEVHEGGKHIRELCEQAKVNCSVYHVKHYEKCARMRIQKQYGVLQKVTIHVLYSGMNWCWLKKTKESGRIIALERMYCHTCFRWLSCSLNKKKIASKSKFMKEHVNDCIMCGCGRAYTRGDAHPVNCKKINKKKKWIPKEVLACRKYVKAKEPSYNNYIHHADFECIPTRDGFFEVDSVGFWNDTPGVKEYMAWCGKTALHDWMKYIIENIQGQIWFFYGSKFDTFFIFEWMIRNGYPVDLETTMVRGNMVYCLGIMTKKGSVVIKDITKFLNGSLKWNCVSFGIPLDCSKTSFDHEKVKTWEDVETHKEERLEYLRLDVISQRAVFTKFADIVWKYHELNVTDFISLAQLSNAITTLYIPEGRLYKIKVEDEPAYREAYYGGRLIMTRSYWESSEMIYILLCEEPEELNKLYPTIQDYLCYYDANSLYPTQMKYEKIACGVPRMVDNIAQSQSAVCIRKMEEEARDKTGKIVPQWVKRLVLVDMDCPDDIFIAFLMRRDKDGNNVQTLEPIRCLWYAGPEILEAIRIGYKVIRVYAYYEHPLYERLFEKFVTDCYNLRKQFPNTAIDLTNKNIINSASGKGAQVGLRFQTVVHVGKQQIMEAKSKRANQAERVVYCEKTKNVLAAVVKEEQVLEATPYSLSTTVWILALSRVFMSTFLREIDGYRNLDACPYYGDTDSLFLHASIIAKLMENPETAKRFGKELGQFKNEIPNGKIVGMIVLAPKTKIQMFIVQQWKRDGVRGPHPLSHPLGRKVRHDEKGNPLAYEDKHLADNVLPRDKFKLLDGQYELMTQMTCKGIPHYSKPYRVDQDYTVNLEEAERMKGVFHDINARAEMPTKDRKYAKHVRLRDRYYVVEEEGKESVVKACITWQDAHNVLKKKTKITCVFGTMQRVLVGHCALEKNGIALDYTKRNVSEELWWDKKKRIQVEGSFMSYPIGYNVNKI